MILSKRYRPATVEHDLLAYWRIEGVYHFVPVPGVEPYVIDTPPPTVSGFLHLGHVYSYSHADFLARFWRMKGRPVLYPMGYDDNGLATERLVERHLGIRATEVGRGTFIKRCLEVSRVFEKDYEELWQRLGLSVDWRYTYRTIDDQTRRLSQLSFIELFRQGLANRQEAPAIWCPECRTAIAQAELEDAERDSEFVTLDFHLDSGLTLPIATTRPELLPACVAVFVHPEDDRYVGLIGRMVRVPLFNQLVPVLADSDADPEKGTGAVMCCTFGDTADVSWWYIHQLDLVQAIDRDGCMTSVAGEYAGLTTGQAREQIKEDLNDQGLLFNRQPTHQSVRVHERCGTPVEYVVSPQWFIRVLEFKDQLLDAGELVKWHPPHMKTRYRQWVENLNWDWCISRQRYYGVTFPVWYCNHCGETLLADVDQLPVDPAEQPPAQPCSCGSSDATPELDIMDTWATSSLSPQLVARWLGHSGFDGQPFEPVTMRPQAHEIIRTWAFYSIVKAFHHFGRLPWQEAVISGWGLAPEGSGKISKSKGGGPVPPLEMIEQYSADAVRYWAASTGLGKDAIISEEKVQAGAKLVNKLWNVARFSQRFLENYTPPAGPPALSLADRWILSRCQHLIEQVTHSLLNYDYAAAKNLAEVFFWNDLADNYIEMAKKRLYDEPGEGRSAAQYTIHTLLLTFLKLFAPFLPYVTESIYLAMFAGSGSVSSIHRATWPVSDPALVDLNAEETGEILIQVATAVRRYKSNASLSLGAALAILNLVTADPLIAAALEAAESDIMSITRAGQVLVTANLLEGLTSIPVEGPLAVGVIDQ